MLQHSSTQTPLRNSQQFPTPLPRTPAQACRGMCFCQTIWQCPQTADVANCRQPDKSQACVRCVFDIKGCSIQRRQGPHCTYNITRLHTSKETLLRNSGARCCTFFVAFNSFALLTHWQASQATSNWTKVPPKRHRNIYSHRKERNSTCLPF